MLAQDELYTNYTIKDGLSSNFIYSIEQDSNGIMWLATDNGLCSFDGHEFECYGSELGVDNLEFLHLYFDRQERLWISSQNKAPFYFSHGELHFIDFLESVHEMNIYKTISKNDSQLYVGNTHLAGQHNLFYTLAQEDLSLISIDTIEIQNIPRNHHLNDIGYIRSLGQNNFSRRYFDNVVSVNSFELNLIDYSNYELGHGSTAALVPFLRQFKGIFKKLNGIKKGRLIENDEIFWGRTSQGLIKINLPADDMTHELLLPGKDVYSIFRDKDQNLWIGTKHHGLFLYTNSLLRLNNSTESNITRSNHFIDNIQIINDAIYSLSDRNQLMSYDQNLTLLDSLHFSIENTVRDFKPSYNRFILNCGTQLKSYQPAKQKFSSIAKLYRRELIKEFCVIDSNSYIVFTNRCFIANQSEIIDTINFSPPARVSSSCLVNDSVLVFGTSRGLHSLNLYSKKESTVLSDVPIQEIIKKNDSTFWFSSANRGIQEISIANNTYNINRKWDITKEQIRDLHYSTEKLYVVTNAGLHILNAADLESHLFASTSQGVIINSVGTLGDKIILASKNHIQVINESNIVQEQILRPLIKYLKINDNQTTIKESNKFSHNQNNISITFAYPKYAYSSPIFKYRLLPGQREFITTNDHTVNFVNLKVGHHTFEIYTQSKSGMRSKVKTLNIEISPPLWKTWWFYVFCLLVAAAFIYYIIKGFKNRQRAHASLIQQRLNTLHAQMNPHFLFNALQSIQYYISKKDNKKANAYLLSFANLVRKTLESSANDHIQLKDEVEYLSSYLILEKDKLDNNLHYEFDIKDQSLFDYMIPSMVLQPIVENAVIHGFSKPSHSNQLLIKFIKIEHDLIQCTISDNGVGISKSKGQKSHQSFASKAVQNRLQLLNQLHTKKHRSKVEINMIENNKTNSSFDQGTSVIINLPCHKQARET